MTFRLCPRLETKGRNVIKGINLEGLRVVGDVRNLALKYYEQGADELIVTDITSSWFSVDSTISLLTDLLGNCFIPITIGGGIRTFEDADLCLRAGAERVSINTATFKSPVLFQQIADKYGCQSTVLHIQAKKIGEDYVCYYANGRESSGFSLERLLEQPLMRSVGEIFLNSVDLDGTRRGIDSVLIKKITGLTDKPIIYGGGVANIQDIVQIFDLGLDAAAISTSFHYGTLNVPDVKDVLESLRIDVRPFVHG